MAKVFIGMGSNLNEPAQQLQLALTELDNLDKTHLLKHSEFYTSKPLAGIQAPDFVNAVAEINTELDPFTLLFELKQLERSHHREKTFYWGPRTLDLDILLYDNLQLTTENLTIPHKFMHERDFVLVPLASLAPELEIPNHGHIRELIKKVPSNGLKLLIG